MSVSPDWGRSVTAQVASVGPDDRRGVLRRTRTEARLGDSGGRGGSELSGRWSGPVAEPLRSRRTNIAAGDALGCEMAGKPSRSFSVVELVATP